MKVQHLCSQLHTDALINSYDATESLLKKEITFYFSPITMGLVAQQLRAAVPVHHNYLKECPVLVDIPD